MNVEKSSFLLLLPFFLVFPAQQQQQQHSCPVIWLGFDEGNSAGCFTEINYDMKELE